MVTSQGSDILFLTSPISTKTKRHKNRYLSYSGTYLIWVLTRVSTDHDPASFSAKVLFFLLHKMTQTVIDSIHREHLFFLKDKTIFLEIQLNHDLAFPLRKRPLGIRRCNLMWQGQQTYNFTTFSYTKKCITFFYYFAPDIFALRNFPVWFSKLVHRLGMIVLVPANLHIIA